MTNSSRMILSATSSCSTDDDEEQQKQKQKNLQMMMMMMIPHKKPRTEHHQILAIDPSTDLCTAMNPILPPPPAAADQIISLMNYANPSSFTTPQQLIPFDYTPIASAGNIAFSPDSIAPDT